MNQTTELGMRVMAHLGKIRGKGKVSLTDLHKAVGGSPTYLAKVTAELSRAKLILSWRGMNGGLQIAKDPKQITLFEVVRAFQGKKPLMGVSRRGGRDPLKPIVAEIDGLLVQAWSKKTVQDLLGGRK